MARYVSIDAVADAAHAAGFRGEAAAVAVAIARPESGGRSEAQWADVDALGDVSLAGQATADGRTWGPSVGAWQVRTIVERPEAHRDRARLSGNLAAQAQAAYVISGGGGNFRPWSVFTAGLHRPHLDAARRAVERRAAGGGTGLAGAGATTSTSSSTTTTGVLTPDVVRNLVGITPNYKPPTRIDALTVTGPGAGAFRASRHAISAAVDATTAEVSELTIAAVPGELLFTSPAPLPVGADVRYLGDRWTVAARELVERNGVEAAVITCRDAVVHALRRTNRDPATGRVTGDTAHGVNVAGRDLSPTEYAARDLSPTEYAALQVGRYGHLGATFIGEGSHRRGDIAPTKGDDGVYESPWEVIRRLADELGYLAFGARGVVYFGRPTWLAQHLPELVVGFRRNGPDALRAIGPPAVRESADDYEGRTLTFRLPRWRGEQVRPGMVVRATGLTGWNTARNDRQFGRFADGSIPWLVHRVTFDVATADLPVIECREAVDPPVRAVESSTATSSPTGAAAGTPIARNGTASALDFVDRCLSQRGDRYIFGAEARPSDPDPDAFDCSELVQWACAQVGLSFVDGAYNQWRASEPITIDEAARTRGALLFVGDGTGSGRDAITHVAVSLGDGSHTIEARGRAYGVVEATIAGRFQFAGLIRGMRYGAGTARAAA